MKSVVIASRNPVKIQAVTEGFEMVFPGEQFTFEGVTVSSNVADQPSSEVETLQGALSRTANAERKYPEADFWVGIEGGIEKVTDGLQTFSWAVIQSKTSRVIGKAKSVTHYLPPAVAKLIEQGKSLGEADDIVFQKQDSGIQDGSIGLLTNGLISRARRDRDTIILALLPFSYTSLYEEA